MPRVSLWISMLLGVEMDLCNHISENLHSIFFRDGFPNSENGFLADCCKYYQVKRDERTCKFTKDQLCQCTSIISLLRRALDLRTILFTSLTLFFSIASLSKLILIKLSSKLTMMSSTTFCLHCFYFLTMRSQSRVVLYYL